MIENPTYFANKGAVEAGKPVYDAVIEETKNPMEIALQTLMKIVDDNKDTEYGRKYGFADIHSIEDYQAKVPVITYDDVADELDRMKNGEKNILTVYPFDHMNETSGSIGAMKVIPLTTQMTQMFVKYNRNYTDGLMGKYLDPEKWMSLRTFCTQEGNHKVLPSGISVGCASSKMVDYIGGPEKADKFMRTLYTSPIDASAPKPGVDSKYLHARFFLEEKHVGGIVSGFFSLVTLYLKYIADNYEMLIDDIENGTINPSVSMVPEALESVKAKISPNPSRAQELREIFKNGSDFPFIPKVWPDMYYIVGVGADGFSNFDKTISEKYGGDKLIRIYSGVTASEGLFSVPAGINNPDSIIAPGAGFMEFLPVDAGDDFSKLVTMDKLEVGKVYEIIYTNFAGLYRYRMSDAIQCTGFFNKTPLVQFMYRVNRTINLVCEKTTEKALNATIEKTAQDMGIDIDAYTVYPNGDEFPVRYEFMLEAGGEIPTDVDPKEIAKVINDNLCVFNAEYEDCMNVDHTIGMPIVSWLLPDTNAKFIDLMVAHGKSPSQQKPVRIITNDVQKQFFMKMRIRKDALTKEQTSDSVAQYKNDICYISDKIWDNPEGSLNEHFAADLLCECLKRNGFTIERPIAGLETAFKASYGQGAPVVGLLAEYDALPGLSQEAGSLSKKPIANQYFGHGCGHNLLAGGSLGAALAIKKYLECYPERGTVVLFGCPDEEKTGAKVIMAREGLFHDLDVAFAWHPSDMNVIPFGTTSATCDLNYTFKGESAHVATGFSDKYNALDAAELMNVGLQYLRNRVARDAQIDYAFADAGKDAPNVVQDLVTVHYCIRSARKKYLEDLMGKVNDLASGAALMTSTQVECKLVGACSGLISNSILCHLLYENFRKLGVPIYSKEDLAYAKSLKETSGYTPKGLKYMISQIEEKKMRDALNGSVSDIMFSQIIPPTSHEVHNPSATDVGDVSRICPVAQLNVATMPLGGEMHTWQAVAAGKSGIAHQGMLKAAEVLAHTVIEVFENPSIAVNARVEHAERTSGHAYVCPLPDDFKIGGSAV